MAMGLPCFSPFTQTNSGCNDTQVAVEKAGKAYGQALRTADVIVGGAGLQPAQTARIVSVRDGKRQVHDGPYAETKGFIGGFVIIDVPNLDAALEWAARHPVAPDSQESCARF